MLVFMTLFQSYKDVEMVKLWLQFKSNFTTDVIMMFY